MKVKDMSPREFIRMYAMRIFEEDALKFGLLLSCGDSPDQAATAALNSDQSRILRSCSILQRLGYLKMDEA